MKRKNKKQILLPVVLLIYVAILAIMTYPGYQASGNWHEFLSVIGISLLLAVLLFFILKRKQKIREQFNKKD
ncbi:MAG: LPXTG cell wall anchor domain-containing protein [Proteiniphilum sp.]|nr:LPXTG cell wall anchor domain-containing protein [Proteiniphilum sp.]